MIGIAPLVDNGYSIEFNNHRALIKNNTTSNTISIPRSDDGFWRLNLQTLELLNNPDFDTLEYDSSEDIKAFSGRLYEIPLSIRERVTELHLRMGHASCDSMCQAVSGDYPSWPGTKLRPKDIRRVFRDQPCMHCILSKRNLDPPAETKPEDKRVWLPGQCICSDPVPKVTPESYIGDLGFWLFTDMATGYCHVIPTKSKDTKAYLEALRLVLRFYKRHGYHTQVIRTDAEHNLNADEVDEYLSARQIQMETSAPYRHHQNGAERYVQTILKGTSALLHSQLWLRADHWNDALLHYIDTRNHTPNSKTVTQSPAEIITGNRIDINRTFKFAFGDIVAVGVPNDKKLWKLDVKNDIGIFIGRVSNSIDTYRIYFPAQRKVFDRGSVHKIDISDLQLLQWLNTRNNILNGNSPYIEVTEALYSFFPQEDINDINPEIEDPSKPPSEFVRLIVPLKQPAHEEDYTILDDSRSPHPQTLNKRSKKRIDYAAQLRDQPRRTTRAQSRQADNDIAAANNHNSSSAETNIQALFFDAFATSGSDFATITRAFGAKARNKDMPTVRQALLR